MNTLFVLVGFQGVGKSTVAQTIARRTGATIISSDAVRAELFPDSQYTLEETARVFEELYARAEKNLREQKSVVLDAMFMKQHERKSASTVARNTGAHFQIIEVITKPDVLKKRLDHRQAQDPKAATYEHYLRAQTWLEPVEEPHIIIDNSGTADDLRHIIDRDLITI